MFKIDDSEIKNLERKLKSVAIRALPFATKNTLNQTAFAAMRNARENVREGMINRNRFTERSIRVEQAQGLKITRQEAIVGSIADYMEDQEFGGVETKTGRHGVAIPTTYSSGEGEGSAVRRRLPRKINKLANVRLQRRKRGRGSRRQQNFIAIKEAAASGHKTVFMDLGRRKGIFRITGGKKRPKIHMIYDLSRTSVQIKPRPWLGPAVDKAAKGMDVTYAASLRFQLKRLGL